MNEDQINKILSDALGGIGAAGGAIGGALGGGLSGDSLAGTVGGAAAGGGGGALGGGLGAKFAAKFLKNDVKVINQTLPLPVEQAQAKVANVLAAAGRTLDVGQTAKPSYAVLIGTGFSNPAVVIVTILEGDEQQTKLAIAGFAKEGLIKQHSGEKAAQKISGALDSS
jgi:hypothetical protein